MNEIKVIDFEAIKNLDIKPSLCLEWVEEAIAAKPLALLPKKISLKPKSMEDVFYNTMPCILPSMNWGG